MRGTCKHLEADVSVVVVVQIRAGEGKGDEALQVITKSQAYCQSVEGCQGFEVLRSKQDALHFILIERWASVEEHEALLASLMSNEEFVRSIEVFARGPEIQYFETQ